MFYLLVPFLLRRNNKALVTICFLSFVLRMYFSTLSYPHPYNIQHAFFPIELGIFLLGTLSHRLFYSKINNFSEKTIINISYFAILVMICFFTFFRIDFDRNLDCWCFLFYLFITIPFIFQSFKSSRIDNFIGELSYPIYLTHISVMCFLQYCLPNHSPHIAYYTVFLSTLLSIPLVIFIQKPIDKFRHSIICKNEKISRFNKLQLDLNLSKNSG
jgi:peptidoglycan/LPS O-acetylase OafA/YrhL